MANNLFIRVGTDVIEIKRIRRASRNPKFLANYFSADEIRYLVSRKLSAELIAENYCAKMAFAKAIGTGFRIVRPNEITILRDSDRFTVHYNDRARENARRTRTL